jgi:hypothetical protein
MLANARPILIAKAGRGVSGVALSGDAECLRGAGPSGAARDRRLRPAARRPLRRLVARRLLFRRRGRTRRDSQAQ